MKIDTYDVKATSNRSYFSFQQTTMTSKKTAVAAPKKEAPEDGEEDVKLTISDEVKKIQEKTFQRIEDQIAKSKTSAAAKIKSAANLPKSPDELKLSLLEMMIEKLTGKKMRFRLKDLEGFSGGENRLDTARLPAGAFSGRTQTENSWEYETFSFESESVSYNAQGVVKTADGQTINFDINMQMSREFMSYTNVSVKSERSLCDPLVINYGGTAASLTGETFDFDLTMDGRADKISSLGEGSGFLALDKNNDGRINDGSELFGPQSGNGFDELRKYDEDKNGWIDENDDIFSKLLVWSKDKDGKDQLFTLKELDIGAIYLGDIETQFSFTDNDNQTTGVMRSTSFFLKESGGAGTVSHVDLAI